MAEKTNTMASHRMTPVSEKPGSRGASIRTLPDMLPTMMPSGRASRMAMIYLSAPITHSFENEDPLYSTRGRTNHLHDPDLADVLHHIDTGL